MSQSRPGAWRPFRGPRIASGARSGWMEPRRSLSEKAQRRAFSDTSLDGSDGL